MTTFAELGVPEPIVRRLSERGIDEPFDIQAATIPDALAGRDLCGKAPTGSGKTIAFGVPLVALVKRAAPKRPKALVLVPTRELAIQVADELVLLGDQRVLAVYGGAGIEPQMKKLRAGVDVVVACPGRLSDVIERKACDLRDVSFVVVDEADRMADMGFLPEVRRLLDQTSAKRQTLLFSATLDGAVDTLVSRYQRNPVVHEAAEERRGTVTHRFWACERKERVQLTAEIVERVGPTVVFSRTKHGADRITRQLEKVGVSAAAIHGNRSQGQRERALAAFHGGKVMALVATDVAARGIHVEGVAAVVHFDLPNDPKDYVHRSGRTGRAGSDGTVVALVGGDQHRDARKLAKAVPDVGDVSVSEPDVSALPAGYEAFRRTSDGKPGSKRDGNGGARVGRGSSSNGGQDPAERRSRKKANPRSKPKPKGPSGSDPRSGGRSGAGRGAGSRGEARSAGSGGRGGRGGGKSGGAPGGPGARRGVSKRSKQRGGK
ncbi:MAG: DEAD/DEAH box helicase [Acidimicrobiales bacterium]|nr:DEAD/DEAH box helicase [Acidimicrobiales bacterium]